MKKNAYLIFLCFLFLFTGSLHAQNLEWGRQASGGETEGWLAAADKFGNSFACGLMYRSSATFGSVYLSDSNNKIDIFLVKYAANGDVLWGRQTKGNSWPISITTDTFGNVYLLGIFDSAISLGTTILTDPSIQPMRSKYFIAKYNREGDLVWTRLGCSTASMVSPPNGGITTDLTGKIYVTVPLMRDTTILSGDTLISSGAYDVLVAKYDEGGNVIWHKQFGGEENDQPTGMYCNSKGHIYIDGLAASASITYGTSTVDGRSFDIFTAKMDTAGNFLWLRRAGGDYASFTGNVASDTADNAFVIASYRGTYMAFGADTVYNAGQGCIVLTKYNPTGEVVWVKNITVSGPLSLYGPKGYSVVVDPCGNIWICGTQMINTDTIHIDGNAIVPPPGSEDPMFIAGCHQDGTFFQYVALPSGGDDPYLNCIIACDRAGNIFVANDNISTMLIAGSDTLVSSASHELAYMAKYNPGLSCGSLAPIKTVQPNLDNQISIFPNPANTLFTIQMDSKKATSASVKLYNMLGVLLIDRPLTNYETMIRTDNLPSGVYNCLINIDGAFSENRRVIIVK